LRDSIPGRSTYSERKSFRLKRSSISHVKTDQSEQLSPDQLHELKLFTWVFDEMFVLFCMCSFQIFTNFNNVFQLRKQDKTNL